MTRKQAIEKAISAAWADINPRTCDTPDSEDIAAIAYDLGRLAGLREAERTVDGYPGCTLIEAKVNRLAKKLGVKG